MAMDFVDRLIVDTLLRLDESFFDTLPSPPQSINELNLEQVYAAVVLLLWSCDPSTRSVVTSRNLPQGMAARYRAATDVVEAVKRVGVRDEIGYQTLLYGQAKELRNVLIGLIEKLPRECPLITTTKDPRTLIVESAANLLRTAGKYMVINKYFCSENTCWRPSWGVPRRVAFSGFNGDTNAALKSTDWRSRSRAVLCACLEANASVGTIPSQSNAHMVRILQEAVHSERTSLRSRRPKPPLPAKPKPSVPPKPVDLARKEAEKAEEAREVAESKSRLNAIAEETIALRAAVELRIQQLTKKKEQQNEYAECLEELRSQESHSGLDPRIKQLLEQPEIVNKLTKYVEESEERMEGLQNRWIALKLEKDEELRKARIEYESVAHRNERQREACEMMRLADAIESELALKHKHLSRLKREVEKMEQVQLNRNAYTKRIFEVVANIRKQQQDMGKVLAENRQIQKEIKSLTGKLDRTFAVVEEKLYRDTQRDTSMQKAYRLLVKIHEECSWVVSATEACGRISREIDELNDQIAIQQQKRLDETLENLLNDWMEVKRENDTLLSKLHS